MALAQILFSDVRSKIALRQVRETQRTLTLFYFMQGILKRFEVTILKNTIVIDVKDHINGVPRHRTRRKEGMIRSNSFFDGENAAQLQMQCLNLFSALCICHQ